MDVNIKATQVLELLAAGKVNFFQDETFAVEYFSRHAPYLDQFLNRSQKFLAGELDEIPPVELDGDLLRLPYQETYIEGSWHLEGMQKQDRVIFLCTEHKTSVYRPEGDEEYRFAVRTLIVNNNGPRGVELIDPLYITVYGVMGEDRHPFMKMYKLTNQEGNPAHRKLIEERERLIRDSMQSLQYRLLHFLALISCSNVGVKDVDIPERMNTARKKCGKLPFFRFKTLFLRTNRTEYSAVSKSEASRASPCLHWRRGHIRKLQGGERRIWVAPSLVGDPQKGFVDKNYKLH